MVQHERKLSQRFLKWQLAWISERGPEDVDHNCLFGPISSLPRPLICKDALVPFCQLCLVVHRKVVEGSGVGSAGCVVHVEVRCMESELCCGWLHATEHGRYGLSCMQKLWSA